MARLADPRPLSLITLLLALVVVLQQYTQLVVPTRYFIPLMVLWYTLAIFYVILLRWVPRGALARAAGDCLRPV